MEPVDRGPPPIIGKGMRDGATEERTRLQVLVALPVDRIPAIDPPECIPDIHKRLPAREALKFSNTVTRRG